MAEPSAYAIGDACPAWCCGDHDDGHVSGALTGADREGRPFAVWLERVAGDAGTFVAVHVEGDSPDRDIRTRVPVDAS